jgi:hypothetical protein
VTTQHVADRLIRSAGEAPRRAGAERGFRRIAKGIAKGTPLCCIGTAEEFANLACFLASEQGS